MKRLALVAAAVVAVAACGKKDNNVADTTMPAAATTPMTDTAMAGAPAAGAMDTSMKMNDTMNKMNNMNNMGTDTLMKRTTDTMIHAKKTTTVTKKP